MDIIVFYFLTHVAKMFILQFLFFKVSAQDNIEKGIHSVGYRKFC